MSQKMSKQALKTCIDILCRDRMVIAGRLASGELDKHPGIREHAVERLEDLDAVIDELERQK